MLKYILYVSLVFFSFTSLVFSQEEKDKSSPEEKIKRWTKIQNHAFKNVTIYNNFKLYTDSILTVARKNNLKEYEIDAIMSLADFYKKTDEYDEALTQYIKALEISKDVPNSVKQTDILMSLGNLYSQINDKDKAKESFEKALQSVKGFEGVDTYKITIYLGLADVAHRDKNFKRSLEYLEKAEVLSEKQKGDDFTLRIFNKTAQNYLKLEKYELASIFSKKAIPFLSEAPPEDQALCYYLIGASLVGLKQYDDSVQFLEMAGLTSFTWGGVEVEMLAYQQLAFVFRKQGELEKANVVLTRFTNAKGKYLKTLSAAQRLEVEHQLSETEELLKRENTYKWSSILVGVIIILFLLVLLVVYKKKRKQIELEAIQLKEVRRLLESENKTLTSKIIQLAKEKAEKTETEPQKIRKSLIPPEKQEEYVHQIVNYMEEEEPYLDFEMKQSTFAENLNMSVHLLSEILNVCFEKNFNNFMNLYRVDKAKQLIKDPAYSHYKMLAIGYEAGFPSKTSFNRVFKQLVGQTPSAYRKQQLSVVDA